MSGYCKTCAKWTLGISCAVLVHKRGGMGWGKPCWAWSDDAEWAAKVDAATKAYSRRHKA